MAVPQLNWTRTVLVASTVLEVTRYRFGAEETASSMGRVTCASISSGATLGHVVTTATVGIETLGSRSIGRRGRQIAPNSTSAAMRIWTAPGLGSQNRTEERRV